MNEKIVCDSKMDGDSDVGDFMMVTDFRCWWQNHHIGDFFVMLVMFSM